MDKLMCKYDNLAIPKAMCFFDRESDTEPDDCMCCKEVCEEFNEKCDKCPIQEAFTKLAAYEAVIFSPDKLREIDRMYLEKCEEVNRLKALLDNEGWIDVNEELPKNDNYIMVSFQNFSLPAVGRYEEGESGGAFYLGDEDVNCVEQGLFVNAWKPVPKAYRPEEKKTGNNAFCEWEYDEVEEGWQTSCGTLFKLHEADKECTHFCSCCGKEIKVVEG